MALILSPFDTGKPLISEPIYLASSALNSELDFVDVLSFIFEAFRTVDFLIVTFSSMPTFAFSLVIPSICTIPLFRSSG